MTDEVTDKKLIAQSFSELSKNTLRADGSFAIPPGMHAKRAAILAFEMTGGIDALAEWAGENPTDFYTKVYAKLLSQAHTAAPVSDGDVKFAGMSDAELERMILALAGDTAVTVEGVVEDLDYEEVEDAETES